MALVAYDYSSESDNEDNSANETENTNIVKNNADEVENEKEPLEVDSNDPIPNKSDLFSALPQKKSTNDVEEAQIEDFVPKSSKVKEKQKVRITIPSLSQFADEEDEPQSKKLKPSLKTSGLISLLPPVKGAVTTAKSFVPNIVNKNMNSTPVQSPLVPNAVRKKAEAKKAALLQKMQKSKAKIALSDAESDDDIEMPESFDDEMWEKVCGRPKPKPQPVIQQSEELPPQEVIDIAPEPEKQYDGLDNKAFKELVGKSKRPIGNIKLIDINEGEILPDKDIWMVKSLTDPQLAAKAEIEDPVDPTRRRKHHITYLAQQAKANEQELQNAWAASRNNRMATKAKYGF